MSLSCLSGSTLLGLSLLLLAACTEQRPSRPGAEDPAPAGTARPADTAADTPDTMTVARIDTVRVKLSAFTIDMPASLRAGVTVFRVRNTGRRRHNFKIEHEQLKNGFDRPLQPGNVRNLKVNLRPGTYKVYCPIGKHADRGMTHELTVEGSNTSA